MLTTGDLVFFAQTGEVAVGKSDLARGVFPLARTRLGTATGVGDGRTLGVSEGNMLLAGTGVTTWETTG